MNPFFSKKIKCPICGNISEVMALVSESYGEYYPSTREKDQYVPQWRWKHPELEHINPYFYSLITCPVCFYTNFPDIFGKMPKILSLRELEFIRHKIEESAVPDKKLVNEIGNIVFSSSTNRDYTTGLLSYILGIYFHNFLNERETSSGGYALLARLYLRISWLYREHSGAQVMIDADDEESQIEQTVTEMVKILNEYIILGRKLGSFYDGNFSPNIFQIKTVLEYLEKGANQLTIKTQEILNYSDDNIQANDSSTYEAIIKKSLRNWKFIPADEENAIRIAAGYFEKSWINDNSLSEKATWKVLEMVAYLYDKIGESAKRDACLRQIINSCHKFRMRIMNKLQTNISLSTKAELELDLKSINTYIQEITYQYKEENKKETLSQ